MDIVWFRRDLRLHDNETLASAVERGEVLPVYCVDPREFAESEYADLPKTGPYRARFLLDAVNDLRASLRARGGDLLVREGPPEERIPELAAEYDADTVHFQTMPATEELEVENAVKAALPEATDYERYWTHTLYHINDLPTPVDEIDDTFTPWRKEVERNATVRDSVATPSAVSVPDAEFGEVPSLAALGYDDPTVDERGVLDFRGGETRGRERLHEWMWEDDNLRNYKATRNGLLGNDYSSKFSPWLAHGCLSPRYIKNEVSRYEEERVSNTDTYWLVFELLWRDFFQFQFIKHGAQFFYPGGIREVDEVWAHDETAFERWAAGETGIPFVDANMRELNETGFMSNRGRQNVASFLTDVLEIDWRWGAAYFESRLVDYDPCSNWGNWAYQAGVGNDSRDGYFNVLSQAERYDGDAEYVTHWLPELADLPATVAHRPWRMGPEEQARRGVELGVDYPEPMVDIERRYEELANAR
ncbi:DASH family cryptochrome [Natronomonas sp. EA1]|uniref:DASH family cryptochrome n=1 Tax=Natronomonas sp. EA1 TaxID=3421655 RepID=UPI003EBB1BCE